MVDITFSPFCAYSYAWRVNYKPQAFEKLEETLIEVKSSNDMVTHITFKNIDLVEQIIDSYGKLGFLFYSRDRIREINGKVTASHVFVQYYLTNFIYDCKAYLDSVAVMLNDFYDIGKSGGDIDFYFGSFKNYVMEKEPKLANIIKELESWFIKVYNWRRDLIHKYSTPIGWHLTEVPSAKEMDDYIKKNPPCLMLVEPQPYLSANFPELNEKHGTAFIEIIPLCQEWITNACHFYDHVCEVITEKLV